MKNKDLDIFEQVRPKLLGLAYRLLGSYADAEDAVQECFLKWQHTEKNSITQPMAWLTTVCTRYCLDILKSAHRSRETYIGPWLPEPIQSCIEDEYLATSLSTAFLLVLERLTPKERAAFLLHDIFDQNYADIASTLELSEAGCRQLVSRARQHVKNEKPRYTLTRDKQTRLLKSFLAAVKEGDERTLQRLLSDDIRLVSDGGGKVPASLRELTGEDVYILLRQLSKKWEGHLTHFSDLSGALGVIVTLGGELIQTMTFSYTEKKTIGEIFVVRNPDKLQHLEPVTIY